MNRKAFHSLFARFKNLAIVLSNDMKLRNKLIATFSVFIVFPLLFLGIASYFIFRQNMLEAEEKSFMQSMVQMNNTIDYFYEIYMNKSHMIFNNRELQEVLTSNNHNVEDQVQAQFKLNNIFSQLLNDIKYPYMKNSYYFGGTLKLAVYPYNTSLYFNDDSVIPFDKVKDEAWCREMFESGKLFSWQSNVKDNYGSSYIVMNRRLLDFNTSKDIGIIRLHIPKERLKNIFANNTGNALAGILYVDQNNNDIYAEGEIANDSELVRQIKLMHLTQGINYLRIRNCEYMVGYFSSNITGWHLIYIAPVSSITVKTRSITLMTIIIMIASIIMCVFIASIISFLITKRIAILVAKTNRISGDNLVIDTSLSGNDEIGQLDRNFNAMISRIKMLIENDYKLKLVINKTKLELLQEQINPHMLYNSLSFIGQAARNSDNEKVLDLANNLISFYCSFLNKGKLICSLAAEIEMTKRYIVIMNFVYDSNIEAIYEIDDEILDLYSIKLFLQPLVENAVIHGIKPKGRGVIIVTGKKCGDTVELVVSDDGAGMEKFIVDGLNSILDRKSNNKGYGLKNVIKRINLFFGDQFGISINSTPEVGTSVKVVIPALNEKEIVECLESKYLMDD